VRIVTVNAWGGAMYDELVAWLPDVDADMLCLQEMTRTPGLGGWTHFEDDHRQLPQRADLVGDVARTLPGHVPWFTVCDSGPVHDESGQRHQEQFGLPTYVRAELPVVAQRAAYVHGAYTDHGDAWPHSGRPRAAQVARVYDAPRDRFVTVGHLHGLRDGAVKGVSPARRAQAERLAALVDDVREPGDLTVVCGDLNPLPDSETFAVLGRLGLTDLVGEADTRTARYPKPVRHASYLLVSEPAAVERFEVVHSPEVSDHRPLLVELR